MSALNERGWGGWRVCRLSWQRFNDQSHARRAAIFFTRVFTMKQKRFFEVLDVNSVETMLITIIALLKMQKGRTKERAIGPRNYFLFLR